MARESHPARMRAVAVVSIVAAVALAGCHEAGSDGTQPDPTTPDWDGLVTHPDGAVQVTVAMPAEVKPGTATTWGLTVTHTGDPGDEPFPYSSICHNPWGATLKDASGKQLEWSEPRFECEAYGTAYMAPGDSQSTNWTWKVQVWDPDTESYKPLPKGHYALEFYFERQEDGVGRSPGPTAEHRFTV